MPFFLVRLLVFALLLPLILTDKCGGNCPAGNCNTCDCGTTANFTDLGRACNGYSWDQNCCKCIILRRTYGNTNYMSTNNSTSLYVTKSGLMNLNSN